MQHFIKRGKVIFVGAGPGDPELITLKGIRHLQGADVILADRLVSSGILTAYASPQAKIIEVGKQCRTGASTPQAIINELMVLYAQDGKRVVRLKGGDVSVFSNILDELQTLVQHRISYEVVPGITAALGAAAYAGIPLTARGHAAAVRFLTAYKPGLIGADAWKELAQTSDTLVFYMSSETLPHLVQQLIRYGSDPENSLAVIEQATTPQQRVSVSPLHAYEAVLGSKTFISPALVIVGKVVNLHQQFSWINSSSPQTEYFKPVSHAGIPEQFALTA